METAMNYLPIFRVNCHYKFFPKHSGSNPVLYSVKCSVLAALARGAVCTRSCCFFRFLYTQCIPFASLLYLSVEVKHLNKVSPQNFALFPYSS